VPAASFSVRLVNEDTLTVSDYWSSADVAIKLPADYKTSWFRFVYSRYLSLYKFEPQRHSDEAPKFARVFNKKLSHASYVERTTGSEGQAYSQLLVGGVGEDTMQVADKLGNMWPTFMGMYYYYYYFNKPKDMCRTFLW
jgi:hypothetical protein